jgi:hypothetical protein
MSMKKFAQGIMTALMTIVLMAGLYGCTKEGPIEKAGKKVDKAVEQAKDAVK